MFAGCVNMRLLADVLPYQLYSVICLYVYIKKKSVFRCHIGKAHEMAAVKKVCVLENTVLYFM